MTNINEILPFGTGGSAQSGDVMPLADYAADQQRLRGHQPGIARRELENTALRQTSHMSAGVAQFIAHRFEPGVKDNGDLNKVEEGLECAINGMIDAKNPPIATTTRLGVVKIGDGVNVNEGGVISVSSVRKKATADIIVYVDSVNGKDANDGSFASPVKTWEGAFAILRSLDANGFSVTLNLAKGQYPPVSFNLANFPANANCLLVTGAGSRGSGASTIAAGGGSSAVFVSVGVRVSVKNCQIYNSAVNSGRLASVDAGARLAFTDCALFGFGDFGFFNLGYVYVSGTTYVDGSFAALFNVDRSTCMELAGSLVFGSQSAVSFVNACVVVDGCGALYAEAAIAISGTATGKRYNLSSGGVVFTNGKGVNFFPGSLAGVAVTGGQYV